MKIEPTCSYFSATFTGYNGSRGKVLASASGCWKTESEAEAALQDAIRVEAESILDGNGYGYSEHDEAELRDMLADKLSRDLKSLDEGDTGEIESTIKAAVAKYGAKIPVSCGAMGLEFGDDAENEDDLLAWAIKHDHQRLVTSYIVTPSLNGRLVHELSEELAPGDLPSWDADQVLAERVTL